MAQIVGAKILDPRTHAGSGMKTTPRIRNACPPTKPLRPAADAACPASHETQLLRRRVDRTLRLLDDLVDFGPG
ncbi:hypothetical protein, partial [Burkholderia thailandensis]|uniref:hypothetical protein n=1 Tax=Burkholderia thailandensis TaxID=57975 RepID=UPI0021C93877